MNIPDIRRAIPCLVALAFALHCLTPASPAAEDRKIDLAEAKAELEKSRAAKLKQLDPVPAPAVKVEVEPADSPPRKRLFSRMRGSGEAEAEAERVAVEAAESATPASSGAPRRRLSLFRKDPQDEDAVEPAGEAEVSGASAAAESEEAVPETPRKRLFGGLLAARAELAPAGDQTAAASPESETETATNGDESQGGALFGLFRRSAPKDVANAEKIKLGNSISSEPSAAAAKAAEKSPPREIGWYVITDARAPFYAVGPGQPMPPDKLLDRGSMITVTKAGWGWCNVKLSSGELGIVSTKAMRPATLAEINRHSEPVAAVRKSSAGRGIFNLLGRGPAPAPELPSNPSSGPIRNFGLLPPVSADE